MDLNDRECEGTDWINLAEDREHWWAALNIEIGLMAQ